MNNDRPHPIHVKIYGGLFQFCQQIIRQVPRPPSLVLPPSSFVRRPSSIRSPEPPVLRSFLSALAPRSSSSRPSSFVPLPLVLRPSSSRPSSFVFRPSSFINPITDHRSLITGLSPITGSRAAQALTLRTSCSMLLSLCSLLLCIQESLHHRSYRHIPLSCCKNRHSPHPLLPVCTEFSQAQHNRPTPPSGRSLR